MYRRIGVASLIACAAMAVVACGGSSNSSGNQGGGGGNGVTASQSWAGSAVSSVNGAVADIEQSNSAGQLPVLVAGNATAYIAQGVSARVATDPHTTSSYTENCSSIGTSGSGTIDVTYTINGSTPVSVDFTYNNCSFTTAGETVSFNGSGSLTYTNYTNAQNFTWTFTWTNLSYSVTSGTYHTSGTFNGTESCTYANSVASCGFSFGNYTISSGASVSTTGGVTTVSSATVKTSIAGGGTVTITFSNWVYDSNLGYATSGTATISASNGDKAVITATGGGHYTVAVTINGNLTTYNI